MGQLCLSHYLVPYQINVVERDYRKWDNLRHSPQGYIHYLPFIKSQTRTIYRYVADGGAATDISSEDALVQTIAGAIWS